MSSMQFSLSILFLQVVLTVLQHSSVQAAVINNCINSTSSTNSCSDITYEQVYNTLAKSQNSFNIESALYPAKKPSSVRVFVNVYGPNKTEDSVPAAKYTWSISCLYAALPAKALEVWSLWSIMVARRTQELDITISLKFCCDVSKGKLKDHVDGVLAALQDLAVSPSIRDPRLNSAECVTEGHKSDIMATGRSGRIITILCCSFLFAVLSGPLLALYVLHFQKNRPEIVTRTTNYLCGFLILLFVLLLVCKEITLANDKNVPSFIHAIYPVIAGIGFVTGLLTCGCCNVERRIFFYIPCANLTAYHFCWLLVGIMLNPTWGLAALLTVCLVIGVFTYAVFTFLCSVYDVNDYTAPEAPPDDNSKHRVQSFFSCLSAFVAVCCLIVVVILAGQSYHGRETADEVLKDGVLYLISVFFSWLYWKNCVASSNAAATSQNTIGELDVTNEAESSIPLTRLN
ncbi:hypothetical protein ACROYT_G004075 [Oculina patagonica]